MIVFQRIHILHNQRKIQNAFIQFFRDVFTVSAGDVAADTGMQLLHPFQRPGKILQGIGFGAADKNLAAHGIVQHLKFRFRLVHQVQNVLRPLAQKQPRFR